MPCKGYRQTEEHRRKNGISQVGRKHSEATKQKIREGCRETQFKKGVIFNEEFRRSLSKALTLEGNPNWKGGRYPFIVYNGLENRKKALERANYKSELSGMNGGKLDVHHIISRRKFCDVYFKLMYDGILNQNEINKLIIHLVKNHKDRTIIQLIYPPRLFEEVNDLDNLIVLTRYEHFSLEESPEVCAKIAKRRNIDF